MSSLDDIPDFTSTGVRLNNDDKRKMRQVREISGCSNDHALNALTVTRGDAERAVMWVLDHPEKPKTQAKPEPKKTAPPKQVKPVQQQSVSKPVAKPKPAATQKPVASMPSQPKPKPSSALEEAKAEPKELSSVADRKRRLLDAAAKRKKEKAIEDRKKAEIEKQAKIMEREQQKRIEAQKANAARVREQRAREIEAAKRKEQEKANHSRRDFAWRQHKFAEKEKKMQDDFENRRQRDEANLKTVDDAVNALTRRYGEAMRNDTLRFISKVASNIIVNPKEERFRSVNAESTAFKEKVVVPLGGLVIWRKLGFELSQAGSHWNLTKPDVAHLKRINDQITLVYSHKKTDIPERLAVLEQQVGLEMTYYAAEKLLEIFDNLLSLKDHSIVGKIDVDDEAFKALVGKHPKAVAIMKQYGFRLHKSEDKHEHRYLKLEAEPDLVAIRNAVGDLSQELKARFQSTPVFKLIASLHKATSSQTLDFIVPRLSKCLQRILDEPLDLKIQSVRLDKFYRKSKVPKKEAHQLFETLGFEITPDDKYFVAKFSEKANIEVLRSQKATVEAAHRKIVGARR